MTGFVDTPIGADGKRKRSCLPCWLVIVPVSVALAAVGLDGIWVSMASLVVTFGVSLALLLARPSPAPVTNAAAWLPDWALVRHDTIDYKVPSDGSSSGGRVLGLPDRGGRRARRDGRRLPRD